MIRPLIHIGYQKTGSTYLQESIFKAPSGGFRPVWCFPAGDAVEHLVLTLDDAFDPDAVRRRWDTELAALGGEGVPVTSHEDLCGPPFGGYRYEFEVARRLARVFPDAGILICVREQKSILRSLYGEYLRHEGTASIEDFLGPGVHRPGFRPTCPLETYEYDRLVARHVELFGAERVRVLPYESLLEDAAGFENAVRAFAGLPKLPAGVTPAAPPRHVGHRGLGLIVQRALNHVVRTQIAAVIRGRTPRATRVRDRLVAAANRVSPKFLDRQVAADIDAHVRVFVGSHYAESNRRLQVYCPETLSALGYDVAPEA